MRKKLLSLLTVTALLLAGYLASGANPTAVLASTERLYQKIKVLTSIIETVQRVYVEEKQTDELIEGAIKGVLGNLDPHTTYLPADDFRSWNQNFEGYTGIGITFEIIENQLVIMSVLEGGPAFKQGLQPGDRIVDIDGESPTDWSAEEVTQRLMGPVGSAVTIGVRRQGSRLAERLHLIRERIVIDSVSRVFLLPPDVGYVKLDRFTGSSAAELDRALTYLESRGMQKLILDLRGNSGGYLNAAIEVADRFIPGGKRLLTTKGRLPSSYQEYYSTAEPTRPPYALIVLIDHGSASASEIVAGAIQDLDRGLLVGKASFGKGLVQSQYRFHDGSALLITTARYYTPSGRAIQRDYYDKTRDEYYREAYNDALRRHPPDLASRPRFQTASGRTVYGGGGIVPDVLVDTDANLMSRTLQHLLYDEDRHLYAFCTRFYKEHPELAQDRQRFIEEYEVDKATVKQFIRFVKQHDYEYDRQDLTADYDDLRFLIKRELAYLIWDADARYLVNMRRDRQLLVALQHFRDAERLLFSAGYLSSNGR